MRSRVALLIVLALAGTSCSRTRPPNVLIIVVDTLRADRLGVYGNTRGLTPFLDELAQGGTVFVNAYAVSSWTIPSVASLLTSRYPSQHHVIGPRYRLADEEVTFAEALQPLHYITGGFSANFVLLERLGLAQGFQYWRADVRMPGGLPAPELRQQGLQWLDQVWDAGLPQPALLYFQFMDPHSPYDPPEPYRSQALRGERGDATAAGVAFGKKVVAEGLQAIRREDLRFWERLYDGEVASVDADIKVLFAELHRRGFLDNAIVVITADHGEEFWEHGGLQHGRTLYDESVRVPFILVAPGYRGGQRLEEAVSLIDLAPTLVDLLGIPRHPRFEGRSLVPLLESSSLTSRLAARVWGQRRTTPATDVIMQLESKGAPKLENRKHEEGIVRHATKLLVDLKGRRETYDLAADPGETNANPAALEPMATTLAAALDETNRNLDRRAGIAIEGEELDEATKEKLRALGYKF